MAEQGISHDALLAGLHDIRLPEHAAGGVLAEVMVALALGLAAALLVSLIAPLFAQRKVVAVAPALDERVAVLRDLPEEARALALLHLLREVTPEVRQQERRALYTPGGMPEAAMLERMLLQAEARDA